MAEDDRGRDLPAHLRALLGEDGELRRAAQDSVAKSLERVSTGRVGRAVKLGSLAVSGGARLALGRAKRLLGGAGEAPLSKEDGLALATRMVETFAELRGVAMKAGQMLSYVDDGLPEEMRKMLALLQRDAPPLSIEAVRGLLREELGAAADALVGLEPAPIASASIGQVHRARLRDGTEVAVKVQIPGIDQAMRADVRNGKVAALFQRAFLVNTDVKGILEELEERLLDECDYTKEAAYQESFAKRFAGHPVIVVPRVFHDLCRRRVLVTAFEPGRTFHEWLAADPSPAERRRASHALYRFYLGSLYLDGIFNCDPHPGNYHFRDNGQIVFFDFGCCRRFSDERRRAWIEMARAIRSDDSDRIDRAARVIGFIPPAVESYDRANFRDLMRHIYEPYLRDEDYDLALHRPGKTFRTMFTQNPNLFRMNMPADSVFLNRITFGLVSLMADIGAPLNMYRLADAYFEGRDPDWPDDPARRG